ncbi:multi-sensor hybrid histidine kinase [Poseidonocella sedimentorum]|uniref:histidine kinase n=1 Tax=Poseidonocella sedimentorum TaxID=871652 RepID=A0A1I6EHR5_9RHOB|nr:multi-sensor hybrid histidine kinase [Poseidonocella sedimentorum]
MTDLSANKDSDGAVTRSGLLFTAGVLGVVVALLLMASGFSAELLYLALLTVGLSVISITLFHNKTLRRLLGGRSRMADVADTLLRKDPVFGLFADDGGRVLYLNDAARTLVRPEARGSVASALQPFVADPAPLVARLTAQLAASDHAFEDVVTRRGLVRISVHASKDQTTIWRVQRQSTTGGDSPFDSTSLPMLTSDRKGTVLYLNEPMQRLIGDQIKNFDSLFTRAQPVSGAMNQVQTKDGSQDVFVVAYERGDGRRDVFFMPGVALASQNDWSSFDSLPVPLLKIATDGEVLQANRLAKDQLENEIAPGTRLGALVQGLGRPIKDWLREVSEERATSVTEFLKVTGGKKERYMQVTLNRVIEQGAPVIIAVLHDATELKTLEAQFVQSQKMQAIGQLAGGVAHDFNNLLTAISGHCDLLLLRHDEGDPDFSDLVQINQNTNRAAALVGQLLAFSRKQTLSPELLDLRDTLSDLTHLLNRLVGERIALRLLHDPVLKPIRADKRQLEQVLMNLVVNARDAMPDGGEILVETEVVTLKKPLHRDRAVLPAGEYVVVKVADEGIGIPADKQQKVFEPFYTSKRTGEGTGLGLSTAYGIVKQTGGYIFLDSVVAVGTRFTLYFPAASPASPAEMEKKVPTIPSKLPVSQAEGVVLLVEDEAPVRAFASRALKLRGYTVHEAASAEEALEKLEDKTLDVDIFVTDVIMPGMDGPTWVAQALETRPDVKVIFMSGYAEDAFSDEKKQVEGSVFLPKPFSLSDLTTTVQNQLQGEDA